MLNVVPDMTQYGSDVHENAIDVANLYEEPQVIYLWLRSAVEPTNAPAIARMFLWAMFTAESHQPQDQNRVYFFIDEMQQIISEGCTEKWMDQSFRVRGLLIRIRKLEVDLITTRFQVLDQFRLFIILRRNKRDSLGHFRAIAIGHHFSRLANCNNLDAVRTNHGPFFYTDGILSFLNRVARGRPAIPSSR